MNTFKTILICALACFSLQAGAETFETVLTQVLKTDDGRSTTIRANGEAGKGYLAFFWASWCVPCKEELAMVARNKEKVAGWNVISINVDDSAGRLRAEEILKTLQWPFLNLNDESGAYFYQVNTSGELPLALVFDPNGHLLEIIRELKEPALEKVATTTFEDTTRRGWEIYEEVHYRQRDRVGGTSDAGTNTLGVKYASDNWQIGATHNLIRQKVDPSTGWKRFEDEIGPTYVQWQDSASALTRVRLGDDRVEWGKGQLLSARAFPGTDINASLAGLHYSKTVGTFSVTAAGGLIRQQLFGLQLDPTVDLTQKQPEEKAFGAIVSKNFELADRLTLTTGLGAASYRREDLISSSYLTPYEDQRLNYNLGVDRVNWGLDLTQTHYFVEESQKPALEESVTVQVDGYLRPLEESKFQLGMTYLERRDNLPRTFVPVLTEYPALPLTTDSIKTWRLAPRADFNGWLIEPQWIGERSEDPNDYETQYTYMLIVTKPEQAFKTALVYQEHGSNPLNIDAESYMGVLTTDLSESFSGQIEFKTYEAKGRDGNIASDQDGRSAAIQLATRIEKLFAAPQLGQMIFAITRTHQDGYYMAVSGINREELTGFRMTWTKGPLEIRAAACREPGGLVCSAGVCAQRPPLDGFSIDGQMRWNF
jgi:thiol-disulfide isomerase/thioredoxin